MKNGNEPAGVDYRITRAAPEHVDAVALLFDAYRQFYGQVSNREAARAFIRDRLAEEESVIFLAVRKDTPCGFTQLYPSFSSVAMRRVWILNDLFVTPEARRHGVATGLMQAAADFAAETGAARLVLATATDNMAAQELYRKLGWRQDVAFLHFNKELG